MDVVSNTLIKSIRHNHHTGPSLLCEHHTHNQLHTQTPTHLVSRTHIFIAHRRQLPTVETWRVVGPQHKLHHTAITSQIEQHSRLRQLIGRCHTVDVRISDVGLGCRRGSFHRVVCKDHTSASRQYCDT